MFDLRFGCKFCVQFKEEDPRYNEITNFLLTNDFKKIKFDEIVEFQEIVRNTSFSSDYISRKANYLIRLYYHDKIKNCSKMLETVDSMLSGRVCGWEILIKKLKINKLLFGNGFFADQVHLKGAEKTSSNTWINIFFNTGVLSLALSIIFILNFIFKFFKIKNINHSNIYFSVSHYLTIYFIFRSIFEDTLAFVSIDFLLLGVCLSLIKITEQIKKV